MRDLDMVLVPTTSDWSLYVTESSAFAERVDTMLNQKAQAIKQSKHLDCFVETTQASSDYAVMTRKQCSSFNVQRLMKGSEYGNTYVFRIDSHQLVNVTVLSREHFSDAIESTDSFLVFPAFRVVGQRLSRPLLRVRVVSPRYLQERLDMQLNTFKVMVRQGDRNALKKLCVLTLRRHMWNDDSLLHDDTRRAERDRMIEQDAIRKMQMQYDQEMDQLTRRLEDQINTYRLKTEEVTDAKQRLVQLLKEERAKTSRLAKIVKLDASIQTDAIMLETVAPVRAQHAATHSIV